LVFRNRVVSTMLLVMAVAACGGEASDTTDDTVVAEFPVTTSQAQGSAEESVEAVDSEALSMAVMDDGDIPTDLPVPVPAGGEIYPDLGVFEGQSLALHYPSGMMDDVAGFYDAWFADQGIEVEPTFGASGTRLWRAQIDGVPVEIELYPVEGEDVDRLFITYP
jgi:hypothetical protein